MERELGGDCYDPVYEDASHPGGDLGLEVEDVEFVVGLGWGGDGSVDEALVFEVVGRGVRLGEGFYGGGLLGFEQLADYFG